MSCVTCHVTHFMCQVSSVTIFFDEVVVLVVGGSVINGAYPGLVLTDPV